MITNTKLPPVYSKITPAAIGEIIAATQFALLNSPIAVFLISGGNVSGVIQNITA